MNQLANYPKLERIARENMLFFRIVGMGGQITDPHFTGWAIKPYTKDCILKAEVVKRLYLIDSAGIRIKALTILEEPKKERLLPWGKILLYSGIVAMGAVGLLVAVLIATAVLITIASVVSVVGAFLLAGVMVAAVDPAYLITLEDGTMVEIYSDVH